MAIETQTLRDVTKNYGSRPTDMKWGGRIDGNSYIKTALWTFDYDDLPSNASHNLGQVIPANSTIVNAYLRVVTAFTSTSTTSDLTIGLRSASATSEDIDDDGLLTAVHCESAIIAVAGQLADGSTGTAGALVGTTIGATDGELYVAVSVDDLLTGRAEVYVEYIAPAALPA